MSVFDSIKREVEIIETVVETIEEQVYCVGASVVGAGHQHRHHHRDPLEHFNPFDRWVFEHLKRY